jgi:two-component system, cell cycle response regulator
MASRSPRAVVDELVPLAQRVRYMQMFRVLMVLAVLAFSAYSRSTHDTELTLLLAASAGYMLVSALGEMLWRHLGKRNLHLFGALLIVDGIYLGFVNLHSGGISSPFRSLTLLHLIAVTLLASYRTGLKLAIWHSLLLVSVYQSEVATATRDGVTAAALDVLFHELVAFVSIFWLVALATATFSAVNERELRRRRFDLEALAMMAQRLETTNDAHTVAEIMLDSLLDSFGFRRGIVLGARGYKVTLLADTADDTDETGRFLGVDQIMHKAWETRQTQLVAGLDRRRNPCLSGLIGSNSNVIVIPLIAEGGAAGVCVLEHSIKLGSRVERRVVTMVERFCSQGAMALRNAELVQELQDMATTDPLTKIANRRAFESTLHLELARAARAGTSLSLIMMDIDHFKKLNDTHGHQKGDEVLREVARALQQQSRNFDTVSRFGGEEFAIVLPGCELPEAMLSAERFREAINSLPSTTPVTMSVGVASFPAHATDAGALIERADLALYEAKRGGRDRVAAPTVTTVEEGTDAFMSFLESKAT